MVSVVAACISAGATGWSIGHGMAFCAAMNSLLCAFNVALVAGVMK